MQPDPSSLAELPSVLRNRIGVDGCLLALALLVPAWLAVRMRSSSASKRLGVSGRGFAGAVLLTWAVAGAAALAPAAPAIWPVLRWLIFAACLAGIVYLLAVAWRLSSGAGNQGGSDAA